MAAFTSKAAGNWSSGSQTTWNEAGVPGTGDTVTITHAITVDVNTTIGDLPASDTDVVDFSADLTVAQDVTFTVRGGVAQHGSGTDFIMTNGAILNWESTSGVTYTWSVGDTHNEHNRLVVNGTVGNPCTIQKSSGTGTVRFTTSGQLSTGLMQMDYCLVKDIGGSGTDYAFQPYISSPSYPISIKNCVFDGCGDVRFAANANVDDHVTIEDNHWKNGVGSDGLYYTATGSLTTGTRSVKGNFFDANSTPKFYTPADLTLDENIFAGRFGTTSADWASCNLNAFFDSGTSSLIFQGDVTNCYYLKHGAGSGSHQFQLAQGRSVEISGCVHEDAGTGSTGDCVVVPSTTGSYTYTIHHNIVLPNSAGGISGTPFSFLGDSGVTFSGDHLTFPDTAAMGETYAGHAGMCSSFRSNIAYGTGDMLVDSGPQNMVDDYVTVADYNCAPDVTTKYEPNAAAFLATPGTNDIDENPSFVDSSRDIASWDTSLGGAGTWANALTEIGLRTDWDTGGYDSNYTVANLLTYIKAGFAPTNINLKDAGHDGVTIGAVEYTSGARAKRGYVLKFS